MPLGGETGRLALAIAAASSVGNALSTLKKGCVAFIQDSVDEVSDKLGLSESETDVVEGYATKSVEHAPLEANDDDVKTLGARVKNLFNKAAQSIKDSWNTDHGPKLKVIKDAVEKLFTGIAKFVKVVGKGLAIGTLTIPHLVLVRPARALAQGVEKAGVAVVRKLRETKKGSEGHSFN